MRQVPLTFAVDTGDDILTSTIIVTVLDPPVSKTVLGSAGLAIQDQPRFGLAVHDYVGWRQTLADCAFGNIKMHLAGSDINAPGLWVAIAQGQEDAQIRTYAAWARSHPGRFLTFGHEPRWTQGTQYDAAHPDDPIAMAATQAEYRVAWERIIDVGAASGGWGGCKLGVVPIMQMYRQGTAMGFMPNRPLDFYGVDGYADSSRATAQALFRELTQAVGVAPKAIFETSFRNGTDAQQVAFIQSLDAMMKADRSWLGCCFWEGNQSGFNTTFGAQGQAAMQAMANDPFYGRSLA